MKTRVKPKIKQLTESSFLELTHVEEFFQLEFFKQVYPSGMLVTDFNECVFHDIIFQKHDLDKISFMDVVFYHCDFSNIEFIDRAFYRVEFHDCKLVGTSFSKVHFFDCLFDSCNLQYSNFADCKCKVIEFSHCHFLEARFQGMDFSGAVFEEDDLSEVEIYTTPMRGIDLSSCLIEGIRIEPNCLKGMIISPYQAVFLVQILGIKVK